jgi:hypothetical protein
MERSLVPFATIALIVASIVLSTGWMKAAEQADTKTQQCEARQRKRVIDIPRITVGLNIEYRGEVIIEMSRLTASDNKIDALYERLVKDHKTTCDASLVCLDNLIVLELVGNLDSNHVNLIVNTAWAAGYDVVASPRRNRTW